MGAKKEDWEWTSHRAQMAGLALAVLFAVLPSLPMVLRCVGAAVSLAMLIWLAMVVPRWTRDLSRRRKRAIITIAAIASMIVIWRMWGALTVAQVNTSFAPPRGAVKQVWALKLEPQFNFLMVVVVEIANPGPPSIFQNFKVSARINGQTENGVLVDDSVPLKFEHGKTQLLCQPEESISERGVASPTPQGGSLRGTLFVTFPKANEYRVDPTSISVQYEDASGAHYQASVADASNYNNFSKIPGVCSLGELK